MPKIKHRIEKDNYHDYIFLRCSQVLERYENIREQLNDIIGYLRRFSKIFSNSEYELIESYNSESIRHRKYGVFSATNRFIEDLKEFFIYSSDYRLVRYFENTYKLLDSILNPKEKAKPARGEAFVTIEAPIRLSVEPFGNLRREYKDRKVAGNFKVYYNLVSAIVEDINNLEGWSALSIYLNQTANIEELSKDREITFLSYAFKDNIYALFLYDYFYVNNGFLYVDTLFGEDHKGDGLAIKTALSPWINKANQILFLHSIHSDKGSKGLSSWCSWELGEAYSNGNKKFYKVVVAGVLKNHPIIDTSFKELKEVRNGTIIPK